MSLYNLLPHRARDKNVKIIADFDALVSQPIGFKFNGKSYVIKPVTTETFLHVANSLDEMNALLFKKEKSEITQEEINQAYFNLIHTLCDDFTLADLRKMAMPQIHALINLIIRHVTGNTEPEMHAQDPEKKKSSLV